MRFRQAIVILMLWFFGLFAIAGVALAGEPEIAGSIRFSNQVFQAVQLLKSNDVAAYSVVTNYVGRISQGKRSGMWAYRTPPTYEMSDATAFVSLTWCAATIAHDSYHSKLYHEYKQSHKGSVPDSAWGGVKAEQQCMTHQIAVMEHIHSPANELEHAKKLADGHYVKDNESWDDYRKRNW